LFYSVYQVIQWGCAAFLVDHFSQALRHIIGHSPAIGEIGIVEVTQKVKD
jgi:hypothetical protein